MLMGPPWSVRRTMLKSGQREVRENRTHGPAPVPAAAAWMCQSAARRPARPTPPPRTFPWDRHQPGPGLVIAKECQPRLCCRGPRVTSQYRVGSPRDVRGSPTCRAPGASSHHAVERLEHPPPHQRASAVGTIERGEGRRPDQRLKRMRNSSRASPMPKTSWREAAAGNTSEFSAGLAEGCRCRGGAEVVEADPAARPPTRAVRLGLNTARPARTR
jgi:hypothetical protein